MGWWRCEHGVIGSQPAEAMDKALARVCAVYREQAGRDPTQGELANLIEFCTAGILSPAAGDPARPYNRESKSAETTPRAKPRGQQGAHGIWNLSSIRPGEVTNVDPKTGVHFEGGTEESLCRQTTGMVAKDSDAACDPHPSPPGDHDGSEI